MIKDEIINESIKRHPRFADRRVGFIDGAEWMQEQLSKENEGQALLYAVEKTAERTKREVIEKAVSWIKHHLHLYAANISYPKLVEDFTKAMEK